MTNKKPREYFDSDDTYVYYLMGFSDGMAEMREHVTDLLKGKTIISDETHKWMVDKI